MVRASFRVVDLNVVSQTFSSSMKLRVAQHLASLYFFCPRWVRGDEKSFSIHAVDIFVMKQEKNRCEFKNYINVLKTILLTKLYLPLI